MNYLIWLLLIVSGLSDSIIQLMQSVSGNLSASQSKSYSLSLTQLNDKANLYFIAEGITDDPFDIPVLTISRGEQLWTCNFDDGSQICDIPHDKLHINDTFQIQITCVMDCSYNFYAYTNSDYTLNLNSADTITFFTDGFAISFDTLIPDDANFTDIYLTAQIMNPQAVQEGFVLLANIGDTQITLPNQTAYDRKGEPIWNDGLGIFLDATTDIKKGDHIKTLLIGPKNLKLLLSVYTMNGKFREIYPNNNYADSVEDSQQKIYFINLTKIPSLSNESIMTITITIYSGFQDVYISNAQTLDQTNDSYILGFTYESVTQFVLTPNLRAKYSLDKQLYIHFYGYVECTYTLQSLIDTKNFVAINDAVSELSQLDGNEVDNFIYTYVADSNNNNTVHSFELSVQVLNAEVDFGIKRCHSLESNNSLVCIYNNTQQVENDASQFSELPGDYYSYYSSAYFSFTYDIKNCPTTNNKTTCIFQIVCFKPTIDGQITSYLIEFKETLLQVQLTEGITRKDRVQNDQMKYYRFTLNNITDVLEIRFYVTVISGGCYLIASNVTRFPSIDDENVDLVANNAIRYIDISNTYYLTVYGYESTLYSITASVKRNNDDHISVISLKEGISQSFTTGANTQTMYFSIQVNKSIVVETAVSSGLDNLLMVAYPAKNKRIINNSTVWASDDTNRILIASNYTEFIIKLTSYSDCVFSIDYRQPSKCILSSLSRPVPVSIFSNTSVCYDFELNKLEELEIVMTVDSFELGLDMLNIIRNISNFSQEVTTRHSKISKEELMSYCPAFYYTDKDSESCNLRLQINSSQNNQFTLVVQYYSDQIYLMDGIMQSVKANLSPVNAKHFIYELATNQTLNLIIKSKTDTKYKVNARFISLQSKVQYPDYVASSQDYSSHTSPIGTTSLVIEQSTINNLQCKHCMMLISVFSETDMEAKFKIQVSQKIINIQMGQTVYSFIQKNTVKQYAFYSSGKQQTLVSLNGFQPACAKLNVYAGDRNKPINDSVLYTTTQSILVINRTESEKYYIIQVQGMDTCYYELAFSSAQYKVYELYEGISFRLQIAQSDSYYFLYLNSKNQTSKLLALTDYGQVQISAQIITQTQMDSLNSLIAAPVNTFGAQRGSIEFNVNDTGFCIDCYFLIKVLGVSDCLTDLMIHTLSSPIPIKLKTIIQDHLLTNQSIDYLHSSLTDFNVTVEPIYGTLLLSIVVNNRIVYDGTFSTKTTTLISNLNQSAIIYDKTNTFTIRVSSATGTYYTLYVTNSDDDAHMKHGIPFTLSFQQDEQKCVIFNCGQISQSIFLLLETTNTYGLNYILVTSDARSNVILNQTQNAENINLQIMALNMQYRFCLTAPRSQNVSLLLTSDGLRYLSLNSQLLIKASQPAYYSVYNPQKSSLMVEVFQCANNVNIEAGEDYLGLLNHSSGLIVEHTKTAGHYIATAATPKNGVYYIKATPEYDSHYDSNQSLYTIKYSFYDGIYNPYERLSPNDLNIQYQLRDSQIVFSVAKISDPNSRTNAVNILNIYYVLYVSDNRKSLISCSQCQVGSIYNQTIQYASVSALPQIIQFSVKYEQLQHLLEDADYFFAAIVCEIEVIPLSLHTSDYYRIIYESIKLSSVAAAIAQNSSTLGLRLILIWIVIPLIGGMCVFGLSLRFCIKRLYPSTSNQLIEEEEASKELPPSLNNQAFSETHDKPKQSAL